MGGAGGLAAAPSSLSSHNRSGSTANAVENTPSKESASKSNSSPMLLRSNTLSSLNAAHTSLHHRSASDGEDINSGLKSFKNARPVKLRLDMNNEGDRDLRELVNDDRKNVSNTLPPSNKPERNASAPSSSPRTLGVANNKNPFYTPMVQSPYADGFAEIKAHPFFAGIDWEKMAAQQVSPPYVPLFSVLDLNKKFKAPDKAALKRLQDLPSKLTPEEQALFNGFEYNVDMRAINAPLNKKLSDKDKESVKINGNFRKAAVVNDGKKESSIKREVPVKDHSNIVKNSSTPRELNTSMQKNTRTPATRSMTPRRER
jgi:hypothetical protein